MYHSKGQRQLFIEKEKALENPVHFQTQTRPTPILLRGLAI
jgi:hypothetical protein